MKHLKIFLWGLSALFFLQTQLIAQDLKTRYNVDDSKIALQGYSPVSYIDLGLAQKGSITFTSKHEGISYYFTNADQKARFDKNPTHYLPQYGGFCATGIGVGAKFRTDPNKFLVRDDKLYLFLYSIEVDALELWLKDEKALQAKADKNWKQLQDSH